MRPMPLHRRFTPAPLALAAALTLAVAAGHAPLAHAQHAAAAARQAQMQIDIPAQPLGAALNELARQANLQMTFAAALVAGQQAPAVSGRMTVEQALERLLAGSGLAARVQGSQVVVVATSTRTADDAAARPASEVQELPAIVVQQKRESRVSRGATNLPLELKETPQSISTIDASTLRDFGLSGSNDALQYGTGLVVDEWETSRTSFSARGFEVMLTQIDGVGMSNEWGIATGQLDSYLFEKIELIRGANGLLTGVGNSSGTINYVRKRPTNQDGGEFLLSWGSYGSARAAVDYNKVLTEDRRWAARVVAAHEDKDSYLRALRDRRQALYGVVEGQVGEQGVLSMGLSVQDYRQRSPMWGSLTLNYPDGSLAEFDVSASTSQDWTRWNLRSYNAFVEYTHVLSPDWETKLSYNHRRGDQDVKLFYAYSLSGALNPDNTGLLGWPYRSESESSSDIVEANLNGRFEAWGRSHELVVGLSHARQKSVSQYYSIVSAPDPALPAFPYPGDVYAEPVWGAKLPSADGRQRLTRLYGALRLGLSERLKGIIGLNAISLVRDGTAIYGGGTNLDNEKTSKASPYVGLTYDLTPQTLAYASYSDIYQAQDKRDVNGRYLPAMKGVNTELGLKSEWWQRRLLSTVAIFRAEQRGLATEAGFDPVAQQSYYEPRDVLSRGIEAELSGRPNDYTQVAAGVTVLKLTGPDGGDIYEWVPRRSLKLRADVRVPGWPQLRLGAGVRWQSDIRKDLGARQDAYALVDTFAAYDLSDRATLRLNVNNVFDEKYLRTVQYGAIYGAPRTATLTLEYRL